MVRDLSKVSRINPPAALAKLFADPPLVGNESREEYEGIFYAIVDAAKPSDAIAWLFVRDFTDLTWEIKRERGFKRQVLEEAHRYQVRKRLAPENFVFFLAAADPETERIAKAVDKKMKQWETDPDARRKIEKRLADQGHDASSILTAALKQVDERIDEIDRGIACYEMRRMATLKLIENYDEYLARRVKIASAQVIDGEFSEAAE